jgi:hypothetical protein
MKESYLPSILYVDKEEKRPTLYKRVTGSELERVKEHGVPLLFFSLDEVKDWAKTKSISLLDIDTFEYI